MRVSNKKMIQKNQQKILQWLLSFKEVFSILRQTPQALGHERMSEWMNEQNNEKVK